MQAITGKKPVNVTYIHGPSEEIEVRALPVRLMGPYMGAMIDHNEGRLIELYTAKPLEWSDALTLESVEAVLAAGKEINRDFLQSYVQRMKERTGLVASFYADKEAPTKT